MNPRDVVESPETFSRLFLKILDKEKHLKPFKWNEAQRHFHENKTGRDIILKARQLGFSTYIQGEIFRNAVTRTTTAITMAHDDDTTQKLRRMMARFYENCKFGDVRPKIKYSNASLMTFPDFDSTITIATAGSRDKGRGDTYTHMHGSEVAFWPDAEKIVTGAMQAGRPDVILESTPNGSQGWFYQTAMEALDGDSVWKLHFYPWWFDKSYQIITDPFDLTDEEQQLSREHNLTFEQIAWRREKKRELKRMFIQEYPEDPRSCFLTSGQSYFSDLSIPFDDIWTANMVPDYDEGHRYFAGLDFGQQVDYLALSVVDAVTRQQVDLLHINNLPWEEMRERVAQYYNKWHCQYILAEQNSMGQTNIEALYKLGVKVYGVTTTNESKAAWARQLHESIDNGWRFQGHAVQRHEFQNFVSTQLPGGTWRLAAAGSGHDDTVIANMLAVECCNNTQWLVS